MLTSDVIHAIR